MFSNLPVKSSVLYGSEEERPKNDRSRKLLTLKDLVAPQIVELFTISYELLTIRKRPWRNNT
jgi:hypothetical protein